MLCEMMCVVYDGPGYYGTLLEMISWVSFVFADGCVGRCLGLLFSDVEK
jgi:hypothetical protein